jgi:hypothetical protein
METLFSILIPSANFIPGKWNSVETPTASNADQRGVKIKNVVAILYPSWFSSPLLFSIQEKKNLVKIKQSCVKCKTIKSHHQTMFSEKL